MEEAAKMDAEIGQRYMELTWLLTYVYWMKRPLAIVMCCVGSLRM